MIDRLEALRERGALPGYIAVEGPIGVGKTTLARRLAETLNYDVFLEHTGENPFLERFYRDPRGHALQTELFFLFQRAEQLRQMRQNNLFEQVRVSDFLIEKNRLFAGVNLDADEYQLYENVHQHLTLDAPAPDLVVYLQAPTEVLRERILRRGTAHEQNISAEYLEQLNEAYTRFFHFYDDAPLVIVNATELDIVSSERDYEELVRFLLDIRSGRHYFNPRSLAG